MNDFKRGVTLIEVVSVMAIVAVLSAIITPVYVNSRLEAKASAAQLGVKQAWLGLKLYQENNGGEAGAYQSWESENYLPAGSHLSDYGIIPMDKYKQSPCGYRDWDFYIDDAIQYMNESRTGSRAHRAENPFFRDKAILIVDPQCNAGGDPHATFWNKRAIGITEGGMLRVVWNDHWKIYQSYFWGLE